MKKILLFIGLIISLNASALKVGITPNYPPYEYLERGQLKGYDVEIIKELANRIGEKIRFVYMDFDQLIPSLKKGSIDLIGAILKKTPAREGLVDFLTEFRISKTYLIANKDYKSTSLEIRDCKKLDFNNKKIAGEVGSVQLEIADLLGANAVAYSNQANAVNALANNLVDFVSIDKSAAIDYVKNGEKIIYCEYIENTGQSYAVKKGNKELLERLNKALEEMQKDKTIDAIEREFGM